MSEADLERETDPDLEPDPEHQVTPLELFFDLVFVFAITQVTSLLADDPTWRGLVRGMLVLGGALVGVDGVLLADERDGRRRGWRPADDARRDGRDARRRPGGAGRLRRRRRALRRGLPPRAPTATSFTLSVLFF